MKNDRGAERQAANDAIALMAEHHVAPNPENFQLFYRYVSGHDSSLKQAMGDLMIAGKPFTQTVLEELRDRFIGVNAAGLALAELGAGLSGALNSVLDRIAAAERDTVAYGKALSKASGELGENRSTDDLRGLVGGLLAATRAMEARTQSLETELKRSSAEVGQLRAKLDDVQKETMTDSLTGIPNRRAFDVELNRAIERSRKTHEPLCLFMCDIDRFKMFNDSWGHQTGDQVLRLVASCLSENLKGRDTAARYGGEEFGVILPQTTLPDAVGLANAIRTRVESKKLLKKSTGDILGVITISIGVAQFDRDDTAASLVRRADACLYAAKRGGRNLVMAQTGTLASQAA